MINPIRVSIAQCSNYEKDVVNALDTLLSHLGGIEHFVKPGQRVLLKPNLLTDRTPVEAVTTHPEVVRAVLRLVKNAGATAVVADSPSSATKLKQVWERTGMLSLCEEENVELINLEQAGSTTFKKNGISFSIAQPVLDADLIINLPKVKTHVLTTITAAVKNMYGCVPGFQKAILHKEYPTPAEFGKLMAEIFKTIPPALNIADAVTGMEGDGPAAGSPRDLGFLAASDNALALDLTLCRILKIDTRAVPYICTLLGKESSDSMNIEIVGSKLEDVTPVNFQVPSTLRCRLIPKWLVKIVGPYIWIHPHIKDECVGCKRCVEACPVNALSMSEANKAVLSPDLCIECCCCHETCPHNAIEMKQSPFLTFLRKGKTL